jgi:hypothetical protein
MWNDDSDFPSVEDDENEDWVLPALDEDWLEWWQTQTADEPQKETDADTYGD